MTSKERIEAAFKGEPTEKISVHHVSCSSGVARDLLGRDVHIGFYICISLSPVPDGLSRVLSVPDRFLFEVSSPLQQKESEMSTLRERMARDMQIKCFVRVHRRRT
jgi:hypothetical protein